ncbi:hypothetical protein [Mycobacterium sp. OTB74]|uniref:hypothetical protein n=1 Tax=Mycobacterium sp. OTB74 TaxID=1853452 RepID=UPI002473D6C2|nr:hypothetical protein [Mycobacterium sp. OTB74]
MTCQYAAAAVAGPAAAINYVDTATVTINGSAETRFDRPAGQTGSTWHATVTCDNGLSTSADTVY